MKTLSLLILTLVFVSCAQRIKVPINRFINPEAIGGGFQVEYQDTGLSSGVIDFANNSTSNPLQVGTERNEALYLAAGLSPKVDAFLKVHKESSSLLGLKVQVLGNPLKAGVVGHNLAFTLGFGSETDSFDDVFEIELQSEVTDYSLVHGYRFSPTLLIYDGVSLSNYSFEGDIQGTTGLDSDKIDYSARNILGAHIGLIYGGPSFNIKIEWATQKIEWTNTEEKLFQHLGAAVSAGW